jgi:hypothetical protein
VLSFSIVRRALLAIFLSCVLLIAPDTTACSVCLAGDPRFSSNGATAQEAGSVTAYLEFQAWRKTSGLLPEDGVVEEGREVNQSGALNLYLNWTPIDRVTLTLTTPYKFNAIIEEPAEEERSRSTLSGFGDLSLLASAVIWRDRDVLPATWVEARVFGKFPTGQKSQRVDGNIDPHLQLGTGSWDWGLGVAGAHRLDWASLYASLFWRWNNHGALHYQYGDVGLANLGIETPLGHVLGVAGLDALVPGLELNFRYAGYDEFEDARYVDSGGSVLYLTPSFRVSLPWLEGRRAPSVRLAVQLPLGQSWLHNQQHEGVTWSFGLLAPF